MRQILAIVFDLDDTLFPERQYAMSGFRAVAKAFCADLGDPHATFADLRRIFDSQDRPRAFDVLLRERFGRVDSPLLARLVEAYRRHSPEILSYGDVDAALRRWRGKYKLGLITDGRSQAQWAKIDALGLRSHLDHIIVTSDLLPSPSKGKGKGEGRTHESFAKPHPRAFEEMADHFGVPHGACVYVADNVGKDFVAPNSMGWLTVRIAREGAIYREAACAEGGMPAHTIATLDELEKFL